MHQALIILSTFLLANRGVAFSIGYSNIAPGCNPHKNTNLALTVYFGMQIQAGRVRYTLLKSLDILTIPDTTIKNISNGIALVSSRYFGQLRIGNLS